MITDRMPFFLALARDWMTAADRLRAAGVPEGDPALAIWREAAWCHLLLRAGKCQNIVPHLRAVVGGVTGAVPGTILRPATPAEAEIAATALFESLRAAVEARHPAAFGRQAA